MTGAYDPLQVSLSVLIAISASYAALELTGVVTAASGRNRLIWLGGGSVATGHWHLREPKDSTVISRGRHPKAFAGRARVSLKNPTPSAA